MDRRGNVPSVDLLTKALMSRSLLPSDNTYRAGLAALIEQGRIERDWLRRCIGHIAYGALIRQMKLDRPAEQVARVLGFGARMTRFAVAPIVTQPRDRERLARLGAMANLIVSIYDLALDRGRSVRLMREQDLEQLMNGRARTPRTMFGSTRNGQPFRLLTGSYLRDIDALAREHHPACQPVLLHRIVRSMYQAENRTGIATPDVPDLALRRKSALPFVVMGLPSWYSRTTATPDQLRRHLRWLYRLGTVFGWVDDWVDLRRDLDNGHPNRVARATLEGSTRAADLAERVGNLASTVQRDWERTINGCGDAERDGLQTTFPVGIALWLGGTASGDHGTPGLVVADRVDAD
jgi:hypothetical protein